MLGVRLGADSEVLIQPSGSGAARARCLAQEILSLWLGSAPRDRASDVNALTTQSRGANRQVLGPRAGSGASRQV